MIPVGNEGILQAVFVLEKCIEGVYTLYGGVVVGEHLLVAVLDERVAVLIHSITVGGDVCADTELLVDWLQKGIGPAVDAVWVLFISAPRIEVWHTFAANAPGEHVLMCVDKGVDASFSQLVDHLFNLVQVGVIVGTLSSLDRFPHDSKTDEVLSPLHEIGNVFVVQGILRVEGASAWDVWVDLVDDVDSVEKDGTTLSIDEHSCVWVH